MLEIQTDYIEKQNEESVDMILSIAKQIELKDNIFNKLELIQIFKDENIASVLTIFQQLKNHIISQNLEFIDDVNTSPEGFITTMESELKNEWDIAHIHGLLTHALFELNRSSLRIGINHFCQQYESKCFGVIKVDETLIPINEATTTVISTKGNCTKCKERAISLLSEDLSNMPKHTYRKIRQYSGVKMLVGVFTPKDSPNN